MHTRLTKYMSHYNLLTTSKHDFSAQASTKIALIDTINIINTLF